MASSKDKVGKLENCFGTLSKLAEELSPLTEIKEIHIFLDGSNEQNQVLCDPGTARVTSLKGPKRR